MTSDYAVGYKKPPASGQFKKGRSGNPKGRTKGSNSLKGWFEEVLRQPIRLREGDRQRSVPAGLAMLMALMQKSIGRDIKAIELAVKLAEKFGLLLPAPDGEEPSSFAWTEEDATMRPFIEHLIKGGKPVLPEAEEDKPLDDSESREKDEPGKS